MIVSAHQPHYLPWIGYVNRLCLADKFVIMDNMNFTSYSYINRNRIVQGNKVLRLSLPIKNKRKSNQIIKDVQLDYSHSFRGLHKHLKSINYSYRGCIGFNDFYSLLEPVLSKNYKWLIDLDLDIILLIKDYLNIETEILLGSEIQVSGKKEDELFLSLLERTQCEKVLLGIGASTKYINSDNVLRSGGEIVYQDFNFPRYSQKSKDFIKGVSIIDLLFNEKQEVARNIILDCGKIMS